MKIYFSPRVSIVGLILIAGMLRASYWQWERHLEKQGYIAQMTDRLKIAPVPVESVRDTPAEELFYRRVEVSGEYDFAHEMVLRNRRLEEEAGVYVLTPLKITGSDRMVIVNRGFLPLQYQNARQEFQRETQASFVGLIKEPLTRRLFAPSDPPTGEGAPWVDAWLRVDLAKMQRQLPFPIEPFYLEIMNTTDPEKAQEKIVTSSAGREELLVMGMAQLGEHTKTARPLTDYPVPVFDTVIPAGRHFGYVFEWAIMALATLITCIIIQLRPRRQPVVPPEV
jgi:surfeit locus 1 family protein